LILRHIPVKAPAVDACKLNGVRLLILANDLKGIAIDYRHHFSLKVVRKA
jgi:hypothetical protein